MKGHIAVALAAVLLVNVAAAQTTSSMTFCAGAEGQISHPLVLTCLVMCLLVYDSTACEGLLRLKVLPSWLQHPFSWQDAS